MANPVFIWLRRIGLSFKLMIRGDLRDGVGGVSRADETIVDGDGGSHLGKGGFSRFRAQKCNNRLWFAKGQG